MKRKHERNRTHHTKQQNTNPWCRILEWRVWQPLCEIGEWFVSFTFFSLLCNEMKWKRERRREERNEPTKNTIYLLFSGNYFVPGSLLLFSLMLSLFLINLQTERVKCVKLIKIKNNKKWTTINNSPFPSLLCSCSFALIELKQTRNECVFNSIKTKGTKNERNGVVFKWKERAFFHHLPLFI